MNTRLFAVLFTALFLIGAIPIFFFQPFGSASAGITAGFVTPIETLYHGVITIAIGLVSAWAGNEVILILPLSTLIMIATGALTRIQSDAFPAIHTFILGAIMLFALTIGMIRRKSRLLYILPAAAWAYFAGSSFMSTIPVIATPLFFLIGIIVSNTLILAIGVALGITLADNVHRSVDKLKGSPVFATFLSFF